MAVTVVDRETAGHRSLATAATNDVKERTIEQPRRTGEDAQG